jgi:hypothetical protein
MKKSIIVLKLICSFLIMQVYILGFILPFKHPLYLIFTFLLYFLIPTTSKILKQLHKGDENAWRTNKTWF